MHAGQPADLADKGVEPPRRYPAILALSAATAAVVIDGTVVTIALPSVAQSLRISQAQAVLAITVYQLLLAVCLLPFSSLAERMGLRLMFRVGLTIFIVGTPLCLLVESLWQLLLLRMVQAIGAAMVLSVGSALVRSVYPLRILGRGLALNSLIVSVFTALAPVIGAGILELAHWPLVFAAAAPLAAIALLASPALPVDTAKSTRFDGISAMLFAAAMAAFFVAADGTVIGDSTWVRLLSLAAGGLLGWVCIQRGRKQPRPLIPLDLLSRRVIALSAIGALCAFASSMAVLVLLPFRLSELHTMSIPEIGVAMSIWPLATMIAAPTTGMLSDRIPAWLLGLIGLTGASIGLLALMTAPADAGLIGLGWRLALCGASYPAYTASNARLVIGSSPRDRSAPVGGLIATIRIVGQSLGAIIAAGVLANGQTSTAQGLAIPILLAGVGAAISVTRRNAT